MKNFIYILAAMVVSFASVAQNAEFDVRFNLQSIDCETRIACYDVQIQSTNGTAFELGGQNYRIFYDNSTADYLSGTSTLPTPQFTNFTEVQDIGPADASGSSTNLGFESTIGFLNYTMDLNDTDNGGGVLVPASGEWVTTSNLCFSIAQSVIDNGDECIELVWAKDGYTNNLATAFVEVVEWVGPGNTEPVSAIGNPTHDNLDSSDGEGACFTQACNIVIPSISISDGSGSEDTPGQECVTVTLSEVTTEDITMDYTFADGSATNGADFTGTNGSITIPAGSTTADICFDVIDDTDVEPTEGFTITLSNASLGNFTDNTSNVSILDNDVACEAQAPVISGN